MQIELSNIYHAMVAFGIRQVKKTIVAKDKEEAIKTLNEYYDEPEIICLISAQEMINLLHILEEKKQKLVFVLGAVKNEDIYSFHIYEENNPNKKELSEKYKEANHFILTSELLNEYIKEILIDLPKAQEKMLLSDTFLN